MSTPNTPWPGAAPGRGFFGVDRSQSSRRVVESDCPACGFSGVTWRVVSAGGRLCGCFYARGTMIEPCVLQSASLLERLTDWRLVEVRRTGAAPRAGDSTAQIVAFAGFEAEVLGSQLRLDLPQRWFLDLAGYRLSPLHIPGVTAPRAEAVALLGGWDEAARRVRAVTDVASVMEVMES